MDDFRVFNLEDDCLIDKDEMIINVVYTITIAHRSNFGRLFCREHDVHQRNVNHIEFEFHARQPPNREILTADCLCIYTLVFIFDNATKNVTIPNK